MKAMEKRKLFAVIVNVLERNKSETIKHFGLLRPSTLMKRVEKWELTKELGGFSGLVKWLLDEEYIVQVTGPDYYTVYFKLTKKFSFDCQRKFRISHKFNEYDHFLLEEFQKKIKKRKSENDVSNAVFGVDAKVLKKQINKLETPKNKGSDGPDSGLMDGEKSPSKKDEVVSLSEAEKAAFKRLKFVQLEDEN